jgi:MraZ protein
MAETKKKRPLFFDTITNKVDAKGRVSLPSDYRAIVKEFDTSIVCYRSFTRPCIEGCTEGMMENLANDILTTHDFFSEEQDELTDLIFGDAKKVSFDSTGRTLLSEKFLKHAGIKDKAVFVGKGNKFQIWNEKDWEKEQEEIRQRALRRRPFLKTRRED